MEDDQCPKIKVHIQVEMREHDSLHFVRKQKRKENGCKVVTAHL